MNILQRIVLIIGAVALLVILGTTEQHRYVTEFSTNVIWNWQAAIVRAAIISAATAAVYFAVEKRK